MGVKNKIMEHKISDKHRRAKERIEELKSFYVHLTIYLIVNIFITVTRFLTSLGDGESYAEVFSDFGTYAVWLFWGIGLLFHAIRVFSPNLVFGKQWEERQIQKIIAKEEEEAKKYNR